jgi:XTP/dITP diphosphohydrolase
MRRILVATHNAGKVRELSAALEAEGIDVVGFDAFEIELPYIEETGATFEENARLKAEGSSRVCDCMVLADDSGLEVDALAGDPGVHSARYGGPGLDDEGRNRVLFEALEGVEPERRTGRFRCVLAVARQGSVLATFEGVIEGRILDTPKGENGFGYDPLFFHPPSGCTTAELTTVEKQRVSHRGKAIAGLLEALKRGDPRLTGLG